MTDVIMLKKSGNTVGFVVNGHTGYADSGEDLICASVSTLVYTALNSMNEVADVEREDMDVDIDEELGYTSLKLKKIDSRTEIVFDVFSVGIKMLTQSYSDYVTLKFEEV